MENDLFDDHHMRNGEIAFGKLPAVDDVTIQDENVGCDTFQVVDKFLGTASVSSKVYIG